MKSLTKRLLMISAVTGVLLMTVAVLLYYPTHEENDTTKFNVYYYNPSANRLEPEARSLTGTEPVTLVREIVTLLNTAPKNSGLQKTMPDGINLIEEYLTEDAVLTVTFSPEYMHMTPLEEAVCRASIVWTMTELPFIRQVQVLVAEQALINARGNLIGPESRNTVRINPELSPERLSTTRTFKLYFVNTQTDGLVMEERSASVNLDSLEKHIVQMLIDGTKVEGSVSSIPSETKIREVKTEAGICHVDLSSDFINKFNGSNTLARLTLYAIVNSLIENSGNVKKVQFLIESERVEQFHSVLDFDKLFEKDELLIINPPQEE